MYKLPRFVYNFQIYQVITQYLIKPLTMCGSVRNSHCSRNKKVALVEITRVLNYGEIDVRAIKPVRSDIHTHV